MRCYCRAGENTVQCVQSLSALEAPRGLSGCCNHMTRDSDLMRFHSGATLPQVDAKGFTWASLFCAGIGCIFTILMAQHEHVFYTSRIRTPVSLLKPFSLHVVPFAPLFALGGMCHKSHTEVIMLMLLMSGLSCTAMEERINICSLRAPRLHLLVPRVDIQMKPLKASCSSVTGS